MDLEQRHLIIGTSNSRLSACQAESVAEEMVQSKIIESYDLVLIETEQDELLEKPLIKFNDKRFFVRRLEEELVSGRIDAALHSFKDLPTRLNPVAEITYVPTRGASWDVIVLNDRFKNRPVYLTGIKKLATSSRRRQSQIKFLLPNIEVVPITGAVETRISEVQRLDLDGLICSRAALDWLGVGTRYNHFDLEPDYFLTAYGQGALALEMLQSHPAAAYLRRRSHYPSLISVLAEWEVARQLEIIGDLTVEQTPLVVHCHFCRNLIKLTGRVFTPAGDLIEAEAEGEAEDYLKISRLVAEEILDNGGWLNQEQAGKYSENSELFQGQSLV